MSKSHRLPQTLTEIRIAAEKAVSSGKIAKTERDGVLSLEKAQALIHELQVHQVELEMQNEELRRIQGELDAARSRYFTLYNLAPVGYCTLSETGTILEGNLTAAFLWGVPRETLRGKPITGFILSDDQDFFYHHRRSVFEKGMAQNLELRMIRGDGTVFWGRLESVRGRDDAGLLVCNMALSDISPQKQVEQALAASRENAELANRAKGQFLANMSHEIRTPLNGMMGMLQLLNMTDLTGEQRELVEISQHSSEQLLAVISDILDYSKIDSGRLQLEQKRFCLRSLLQDIESMFIPAAQEKGLSLGLRLEGSTPLELLGDAFRVRQVLTNLISNAMKFTSVGGVEVVLRRGCHIGDRSVEMICMVQDTGIGIHQEFMDTIFDRFSQADSSITRLYGGTGLGLPICRSLAALMGGEIRVESVVGSGSCFTFTWVSELPVEGYTELPVKLEVQGVQRDSNEIKLLIIEDDPVSRTVMGRYAQHNHWQVVFANNGQEAVEAYQKGRYHVILMDVMIPVINGYQASRAIRQLERLRGTRTPIVAVTACALTGDREKAYEAGMDDYLTKPIDLNAFGEVVRKWI